MPYEESPGQLIEDGARLRNHSLIAVGVTALVGGVLIAATDNGQGIGAGIMVVGLGIGVGLNIAGNNKQIRGGVLLRRRGY